MALNPQNNEFEPAIVAICGWTTSELEDSTEQNIGMHCNKIWLTEYHQQSKRHAWNIGGSWIVHMDANYRPGSWTSWSWRSVFYSTPQESWRKGIKSDLKIVVDVVGYITFLMVCMVNLTLKSTIYYINTSIDTVNSCK